MTTNDTATTNDSATAADSHRLVREVLARYVRAADHRDPTAMAATFWEDGVTEIFYSGGGTDELLARITGASNIGAAVASGMAPHPPRGWSHHTTVDPIVVVDGDSATFDSQFIVYDVRGLARPESGWPADATGAQGTITPIECGYLRTALTRRDGQWRITSHVIKHDLPYAFPQG
nr:nuclear transport factor 2 family protein [Rhodococcus sp. (in: high G+C Gram-positive bacteria)]